MLYAISQDRLLINIAVKKLTQAWLPFSARHEVYPSFFRSANNEHKAVLNKTPSSRKNTPFIHTLLKPIFSGMITGKVSWEGLIIAYNF